MPEECIRRATGECRGPIVADLVLQLKRGNRNVGKGEKLPLCFVHSLTGGVYSWAAHAGEALIWAAIKYVAPGTRKGVRLTYRVVAREPYRTWLKKL